MSRKNVLPSMEFYQDNTRLKWIILAVSVTISMASIYYTNILVGQLKEREAREVRLYARALEYTLNDTENNILFITEEIIYKNNSIPTILVNEEGEFVYSDNLDIDPAWPPK
ncbi:MAG TPA: histidine kinase, partial [Cyclobacteriaceae bacterium]|nr:histidine kinase [Cyclobacteriaceae bacterium]